MGVDDVGLVALLFQRVADEFGDGRLVVNDKDALGVSIMVLPFLVISTNARRGHIVETLL